MAKNENIQEKPKKRIRKNKKIEPTCWEKCKCCLDPSDDDDFVCICLGDTRVTKCELNRMMGNISDSEEEK